MLFLAFVQLHLPISTASHLTISRRRRGDYKPIFTELRNCFSINFQVTIDRFFEFIFDCLMFT